MKFVSDCSFLIIVACITLLTGNACKKDDDKNNTPPVNAYAIGGTKDLLSFNLTTPSSITTKTISGLQTGETILGIDIRPANNALYALGSTSRLYTIDKSTAAATMVGAGPFSPALNGASFGFDFNPTVDRIRVVSNTDVNFRLHPETAALVATDGAINPSSATLSAVAYSNNSSGATTTVLYAIDAATDKLYKMDPPNNGTVVEIGALGIDIDGNNGFDIGGTDNKAYALLTVGGATALYTINLSTGAATMVGNFTGTVKGLAVLPGL